jgi:hypothetical protein
MEHEERQRDGAMGSEWERKGVRSGERGKRDDSERKLLLFVLLVHAVPDMN